MRYEGTVYRPPSEAYSLIIQLTIGCARNTCTFCNMYKDKTFRVRPLEDVVEDMEMAKRMYRVPIRRLFLADGDALIVKTQDLLFILKKAWEIFPALERITVYGAPKDILAKNLEDLVQLRQAGLEMVYVGLESGYNKILADVKKGVTAAEMVEAGQKVRKAGMKLSMTVISGLGGRERLAEHAVESAKVVSMIKPEYVGFLTLMLEPPAPMYEDWKNGKFSLLHPDEVLEEQRLFLEHVDAEGCVFRSNHASNYVALGGTLNRDKEKLLRQIAYAQANQIYRPDGFRGL